MATKSARIKAQIAALEAAAAAAAEDEREAMRGRVVRAADRAGLLDTQLSTRDLEAAFRGILAAPAAASGSAAEAEDAEGDGETEGHGYEH